MEISKSSIKKLSSMSITNPLHNLNHLLSRYPQFKTLISHLTKAASFHSSTFSSPFPHHIASDNRVLNLPQLLKYCNFSGFKSAAVDDSADDHITRKQVSEVIELIRRGDDEGMESKLNSMKVISLSVSSIVKILRVLNTNKVSAFRFLDWVKCNLPLLHQNPDVCSLAIDNCGRLDDYFTMLALMREFNEFRVRLNENAFGFLNAMIKDKTLGETSVKRVIDVLNLAKDSCGDSGKVALVEMLAVLGLFDMAKYVIVETGKKLPHFNILIREMCRKHVKEAVGMLKEVKRIGVKPSTVMYNLVISNLCRVGKVAEAHDLFKEMQDCSSPDSITYEVFIWTCCRNGEFNDAYQFLEEMVKRGIEPRDSTHNAFIKSYFDRNEYKEAFEYVVGSAVKYRKSANVMYSQLANLHLKRNNAVMACNVLLDMIDKGLSPNKPVYKKVLERLRKSGKEDLVKNLSTQFSGLGSNTKA